MNQHWKDISLFLDYCYNEQFNGPINIIMENEWWFINERSNIHKGLPPNSKKIIQFGQNGKVSKRVNCTNFEYPITQSFNDDLVFNQYLEKNRVSWEKCIYNELNQIVAVERYLGMNRLGHHRTWKYEYDIGGNIKKKYDGEDSYTEYHFFDNGRIKEINSFDLNSLDNNMTCWYREIYDDTNDNKIHCCYYSVPLSDTGTEDFSKPIEFCGKSSKLVDNFKMTITTESFNRDEKYLSTTVENFNPQGNRLYVRTVKADGKEENGPVTSYKYDDKDNWVEKIIGTNRIIRRKLNYDTDSY